MFAYCLDNPVNFIDADGKNADLLVGWTSTMGWLPFADTILPIGDIIYFGGIVVFAIITLVVVDDITTQQYYFDESTRKTDEGIVTPDNPPTEKDGYKPPKGGPKKGKGKNGKQGWVDKHGNIWVPAATGTPSAHGGGHWDVQRSDGKGYINVYPGGYTRPGGGKPPILPIL